MTAIRGKHTDKSTKVSRITASKNNYITINNQAPSENNIETLFEMLNSLELENSRLVGHIQLQSEIIKELRSQLSRYEEHTTKLLNLKPK